MVANRLRVKAHLQLPLTCLMTSAEAATHSEQALHLDQQSVVLQLRSSAAGCAALHAQTSFVDDEHRQQPLQRGLHRQAVLRAQAMLVYAAPTRLTHHTPAVDIHQAV